MLDKIAVQSECWEIKSDIYLELSSITNVSSIRIYIGTTSRLSHSIFHEWKTD